MRWMNHKKSRVMDFFRRIDKDQDGKVTRQEFIEGILSSSKFVMSKPLLHSIEDELNVFCKNAYSKAAFSEKNLARGVARRC